MNENQTKHKTDGMILIWIKESEYYSIFEKKMLERETFKKNDGTKMSFHDHALRTGVAMDIAKNVCNNGGTDEEMNRAIMYLIVCIDARKHNLDTKKAKEAFGIKELKEKYVDMQKSEQ